MSIALVVTRGFGTGSLDGSIKAVVLAGYDIGASIDTADCTFAVFGLIDETGQSVTGTITDSMSVRGEICR